MFFKIDKTSPVPLYHQISEDLKGRIVSGELKPGCRMPAEMEVAQSLGISPMTARQAYTKLVEGGYLKRQHGRGTFVSSDFTEKEASAFKKTGVDFGLLLFNLRTMLSCDAGQPSTFSSELLSGIETACADRGINLHILSANGKSLRSPENAVVAEQLGKRRMEGLLLAGTPLAKADIEFLLETNTPLVSIDSDYKRKEIPPVMIDDESFIKLALRQIRQEGFSRVLLVTGPLCFSAGGWLIQRRGLRMRDAFFAALEENGLKRSHCKHVECEADLAGCAKILTPFLTPRPEAILCDGDTTALAAGEVLQAQGCQIPILSFGDAQGSPFAFAVKPMAELTEAAVELLSRESRGLKTSGKVIIPVTRSRV